jgi:hypothetical protein
MISRAMKPCTSGARQRRDQSRKKLAASHRRSRSLSCCPACQGLKPFGQYSRYGGGALDDYHKASPELAHWLSRWQAEDAKTSSAAQLAPASVSGLSL